MYTSEIFAKNIFERFWKYAWKKEISCKNRCM